MDLIKKLNNSLKTNFLPPKVLQSKFKVGVDHAISLYDDPTYMPFYYHLGSYTKGIKNVMELGFSLGMASGCVIEGSGTVEHFLAFRKNSDQYYAKRLGISNIHNILKKKFDLWIGEESDPDFMKRVLSKKWDCVIVSDINQKEETYRSYLDLIWNQMAKNGLIVVDFLKEEVIKNACQSFCKLQNREIYILETTRGTGIIQK